MPETTITTAAARRPGTLYWHATLPNALVWCDDGGMCWLLCNRPGGWDLRAPYLGYADSLRPFDSVASQRLVLRSTGAPEDEVAAIADDEVTR